MIVNEYLHKGEWRVQQTVRNNEKLKKRSQVKWIECVQDQMCGGWIKHMLVLLGFNSLE